MKTNKIIYIFIISLIIVACEPIETQTDSNYDPEAKLKELGLTDAQIKALIGV